MKRRRDEVRGFIHWNHNPDLLTTVKVSISTGVRKGELFSLTWDKVDLENGRCTLAMVKRYAHIAESHTANVVERMNKKIFG